MTVVCQYDHLDELMTNDILICEIDKVYSVHVGQNFFRLFQSAPLSSRQVDLGCVSGDDSLRAKTDPCQEHFHLFARGVLGLVEDYEGVRQSAAAHKGERSYFDDALLEHLRYFFRVDEVEQSIV